MPADITSLTEGWLELESDPGEIFMKKISLCNFSEFFFVLFCLKVFLRFFWKILVLMVFKSRKYMT